MCRMFMHLISISVNRIVHDNLFALEFHIKQHHFIMQLLTLLAYILRTSAGNAMKCSDRVVLLGYAKVLPKEHFCVSVNPPSRVREVMIHTQPKQLWSTLLCKGVLQSRYFGFNPQDTIALTHTLIFLLTFATTTVQTTSGDREVRHFPADKTSWTMAPGS